MATAVCFEEEIYEYMEILYFINILKITNLIWLLCSVDMPPTIHVFTSREIDIGAVAVKEVCVEFHSRVHMGYKCRAFLEPSRGWQVRLQSEKSPLSCLVAGEWAARIAEAGARPVAGTDRCNLWNFSVCS